MTISSRQWVMGVCLCALLLFTGCDDDGPSQNNGPRENPLAPTDLTVEAINDSRARLQWVNTSNIADGFVVERQEGESGAFVEIGRTGKDITIFIDSTLRLQGEQFSVQYSYRVYAFDDERKSAYSNTASLGAGLTRLDLSLREAPDESIQLYWGSRPRILFTAIAVERSVGEGDFREIARLPVNDIGYDDTPPNREELYAYRVKTEFVNHPPLYSDTLRFAWSWTDRKEVLSMKSSYHVGPYGTSRRMDCSPDGSRLVSADYQVQIWDTQSGARLHAIPITGGGIDQSNLVLRHISYSPDGTLIAGVNRNTLWVWDAQSADELFAESDYADASSLAFSPDSEHLALALPDGSICICNSRTGVEIERFTPPGSNAEGFAVAYLPGGSELLLSAFSTGRIAVWNIAEKSIDRVWQTNYDKLSAATFTPDSSAVLVNGRELWDVVSGAFVRRLDIQGAGEVFSPDNKYLVAIEGSRPHNLFIHDAQSDVKINRATFQYALVEATFQPNTDRLIYLDRAGIHFLAKTWVQMEP